MITRKRLSQRFESASRLSFLPANHPKTKNPPIWGRGLCQLALAEGCYVDKYSGLRSSTCRPGSRRSAPPARNRRARLHAARRWADGSQGRQALRLRGSLPAECRVELAPCRLPVAHLAEHEGEDNPIQLPYSMPPPPRPASRVRTLVMLSAPSRCSSFRHRTLTVEGDDLPGRFYHSRDGDGQPARTTACIQYPHAGSESETLD